jgi:hypothetical protein
LRQDVKSFAANSLLESGNRPQATELKVNTNLEAIQVEMRQKLKDGRKRGETELETTSRLVWLERQKLYAMRHAMEAIMGDAAAALDLEREISSKSGILLRWYKPLPPTQSPVEMKSSVGNNAGTVCRAPALKVVVLNKERLFEH